MNVERPVAVSASRSANTGGNIELRDGHEQGPRRAAMGRDGPASSGGFRRSPSPAMPTGPAARTGRCRTRTAARAPGQDGPWSDVTPASLRPATVSRDLVADGPTSATVVVQPATEAYYRFVRVPDA